MKRLSVFVLAASAASAMVASPAFAAKVGDKCKTNRGEAGHFVATYIAGQPSIKCKADAVVVPAGPSGPKRADPKTGGGMVEATGAVTADPAKPK